MSVNTIRRIAFLGFGEVGGIFGSDLASLGTEVVAFDPLFLEPGARERLLAKAQAASVVLKESAADAVERADLVFCATTASSALRVARGASPLLQAGQTYIDLNSVSPETKIAIGAEIRKSGADFVEAAVMAAVKAARVKTPTLLCGGRAEALAESLRALGMDTTAVSTRIGVASAIKMCRSVVMKGLASLAIESLFTARLYGAEEAVLASFEATYPSMGWAGKLPDTLVLRSVEHSRRRAAEMRESAETIQSAGLVPRMATATAEMQDWLTAEMEAGTYTFRPGEPFSWKSVADALLRTPAKSPGNT